MQQVKNDLIVGTSVAELPSRKWLVWGFVLIQVCVMLVAVSNESLWIDEFNSANFFQSGNFESLFETLSISQVAIVPLHYLYYYFWEIFFQPNEMILRLANLPLFVLGQLSLFLALRAYPQRFGFLLLTVCALHPMVWQYANEARPYMMIYAGSEMILAYMLHLHTVKMRAEQVSSLFLAFFVFGCILLSGANMLGGIWGGVAVIYVAYFHYRYLNWGYLKHGVNLLLLSILLVALALLCFMYTRSVLQGASASKISSTTGASLLFDAYELLGLSGVGPGRLELREAGISALGPYWIWLLLSCVVVSATLLKGLQSAVQLLGRKEVAIAVMAALLPVAIVILSGFAMHWRVLGRHLIASLPVLNLLFVFGLVSLLEKTDGYGRSFRQVIALAFLLLLTYSSLAMRFSDRHRKDDYKAAAAIAQQAISQGDRIWWAADGLGANYYGLPVEINRDVIFTGASKAKTRAGNSSFQLVDNASKEYLENLAAPNVVIQSKVDTFDNKGTIAAYLNTHGFMKVQTLPAFTIWRPMSVPSSPGSSTLREVH